MTKINFSLIVYSFTTLHLLSNIYLHFINNKDMRTYLMHVTFFLHFEEKHQEPLYKRTTLKLLVVDLTFFI